MKESYHHRSGSVAQQFKHRSPLAKPRPIRFQGHRVHDKRSLSRNQRTDISLVEIGSHSGGSSVSRKQLLHLKEEFEKSLEEDQILAQKKKIEIKERYQGLMNTDFSMNKEIEHLEKDIERLDTINYKE